MSYLLEKKKVKIRQLKNTISNRVFHFISEDKHNKLFIFLNPNILKHTKS